ncbi:MAG: phage major capsid protein [Solirubrobacteraceae bacterium]
MTTNRNLTAALELAELLAPTWPAITGRIERSNGPTCLHDDKHLSKQFKDTEQDVRNLRDEIKSKQTTADQTRKAYVDGGERTGSPEFKTAAAAVKDVKDAEARLSIAQELQVELLKKLSSTDPADSDGKWAAGKVLEDPALRDQIRKAGNSSARVGRIALGEIASADAARDAFKADITGTPNMRRDDYGGVAPQLRQQLTVLDVIATGTMEGSSVPYTVENGSFDTAAETTEGTLKPEGVGVYTDANAEAATIAHWFKVRKQVLADVPAFASVLENRLRYGVARRLQAEILAGNGTTPNIQGILTTPGVGVVAFTAGNLPTEQILSGITQVKVAGADPNAIILNPLDWKKSLLLKSAGSGDYFSNGPFDVTGERMWGVPVITTAAIPEGTALVGAFQIGAQLLIREGVNVLVSDADGQDFTFNKVTILAELRAALAVYYPAAFSKVALA